MRGDQYLQNKPVLHLKQLFGAAIDSDDENSKCQNCRKFEALLAEIDASQNRLRSQNRILQETVLQLDALLKKYINLFDFAPVGYFSFNRKGRIDDVNLTGAGLLGYSRKELIGSSMLRYIGGGERRAFQAHLGTVFTGVKRSVEVPLFAKGGRSIPSVMQSSPITDASGKVINCRTVILDISERVQSEKAIQQLNDELEFRVEDRNYELRVMNKSLMREINRRKKAEAELSAEKETLSIAFKGIGDGVITTDAAGKIILMNEVAEELTGWTHEQAAGKPFDQVLTILDETTRNGKNPVERVLSTGRSFQFTNHTILKEKNGRKRIVENSGSPIRNKNNKIVGVVLVIRDITKIKQMEEERLKAHKLEALGFLAGGIAHDFNNLLTAIWGNISLAKMNAGGDEETVEVLNKAENASKRAKYLANQLLTFSKGGVPIKRVASISDLIKESIEFVSGGANIHFKFSFPDDLYLVDIDGGQINHVIHNLAMNAIQAMPGGGEIQIHCENVKISKKNGLPLRNGKYVKISVVDHGVGIRQRDLSKIFDPYFTPQKFGNRKGSGLGLAISYSIVRKHGGLITVDSRQGQGTTFEVYLPASSRAMLPAEVHSAGTEVRGTRVLVMDDEVILRQLSSEFLTKLGYQVSTAADGKEAIDLYKDAFNDRKPFAAVVMDLTVPGGMGGKEAIQELRKFDPNIRAIVASGYSNSPVMSNFKHFGFKEVITKPFSLSELNHVLKKVLN